MACDLNQNLRRPTSCCTVPSYDGQAGWETVPSFARPGNTSSYAVGSMENVRIQGVRLVGTARRRLIDRILLPDEQG
jgi:hypothetical protein